MGSRYWVGRWVLVWLGGAAMGMALATDTSSREGSLQSAPIKPPGAAFESETGYPSLWDSHDAELQRALESEFRKEFKSEFWRVIKNKKGAIVVVDVTDVAKPKVAGYNHDVMMYAASMPKIAIVLGAFVEMERGNMQMDAATRNSLVQMIRHSSNKAATEILRRVGIENLAEILQSNRYRLYDPAHNGGLWIGRDYAGGKVWKRDPLNGVSHGATAMQAARFYYLGITRRLVAPEYQEALREVFSLPAIKHKFVKGLMEKKPQADIYRKSGTWRNFHADSGVVVQDDYTYIVVALGEHPRAGEGLRRLVGSVDAAVESLHSK